MEKIIYKTSRNKEIITEEETKNFNSYFKNYYKNDKLVKIEYILRNELQSLTYYFDNLESIEEILFKNLFINCIFIYKLFEIQDFENCLFNF